MDLEVFGYEIQHPGDLYASIHCDRDLSKISKEFVSAPNSAASAHPCHHAFPKEAIKFEANFRQRNNGFDIIQLLLLSIYH